MDTSRYAEVKKLFLEASQLPATERSVFLDKACGDDAELRNEVLSLLEREPASLDILEPGGLERAVDRYGAAESTSHPESIGPYRVLDVLGEGGMGIVYRAQQEVPIRREVAVKVVRVGRDSKSILARFEWERQTLARMEHPNIARVLDAGSDEHGNPYFVMEIVEGVHLKDYIRDRRLTPKDQLRLFRQVCLGVQHAHQKAIIHRDLKPSNILVSQHDGRAVPKIIDFGISKAVVGDSEEPVPELTRTGQLIGTLEYMSPEQALGKANSIDTRSDVYSLGVILYEIIAGRLPYETRGLPLPEVVRIVSETDADRLRTVGDTNTAIDTDLRTIINKALEKDPDRRYATAAALADDIDRYLRSEPILAHPPSAFYQVRKLVSRHRGPFAFIASLFGLVLAFGVVMSIQFEAQRRERARAESEAAKANAVSQFLEEMIASADPEEAGGEVTVAWVLDEAARDVEVAFADQPDVEAALHRTIGNAYLALGRYEPSLHHLKAALESRRSVHGETHADVGNSLADLAALYAVREESPQDLAVADSLAQAALALHEEHGGNEVLRGDDLALISMILEKATRYAEAESLSVEVVELRRRTVGNDHVSTAEALSQLAKPRYFMADFEGAEEAEREALEIRRRVFGSEHPRVGMSLNDLAYILMAQGDFAGAEPLYMESLKIARNVFGDEDPRLAKRLSNLGDFFTNTGRPAEAREFLTEALAIDTAAHGDTSSFVARHRNNLGACLAELGDYGGAVDNYTHAVRIWTETLGVDHPSVLTVRNNVAVAKMFVGDAETSELMHREILAARTNLFGAEHPQTGASHYTLAYALMEQGRFAEAEDHARAAHDAWSQQLGADHFYTAGALGLLGSTDLALGRISAAEAKCRESVVLHAQSKTNHQIMSLTAGRDLGRALHDLDRLDESEAALVSVWEASTEQYGSHHIHTAELALCLADVLFSQGRSEAAVTKLESAHAALSQQYPADHHRRALAATYLGIATPEQRRAASTHPGNLLTERNRLRKRLSSNP